MQAFALPKLLGRLVGGAAACVSWKCSRLDQGRPNRDNPPAHSISRRVQPSHKHRADPRIRNILHPLAILSVYSLSSRLECREGFFIRADALTPWQSMSSSLRLTPIPPGPRGQHHRRTQENHHESTPMAATIRTRRAHARRRRAFLKAGRPTTPPKANACSCTRARSASSIRSSSARAANCRWPNVSSLTSARSTTSRLSAKRMAGSSSRRASPSSMVFCSRRKAI